MKIYVPDTCTPWRLASLSIGKFADGAPVESVLIDVGLKAARSGVTLSDYVRFIAKVKSRLEAEEYYIIVPDVYGDAEATARNWLRYAPALKKYGWLVYVAQGFQLPKSWGPVEPAVVALPANSQNGRKCALDPTYCVANIMRFLDAYDLPIPIHLLGPAKVVLLDLKRWGYLSRITSCDTSAYRKAPTNAAKEMLGGKWQAVDGVECAWFRMWTRGII